MAPFSGGCMCGAIRYKVSEEPVLVGQCHCRECQYASGGAPANVVFVHTESFTLLCGNPKGYDTTSAKGNTVTRLFCPECGTPLFAALAAAPHIWIVTAGSMDDASWLKPTMVFYTSSAQPWAHIDASLEAFEKTPDMTL